MLDIPIALRKSGIENVQVEKDKSGELTKESVTKSEENETKNIKGDDKKTSQLSKEEPKFIGVDSEVIIDETPGLQNHQSEPIVPPKNRPRKNSRIEQVYSTADAKGLYSHFLC